MKIIADVALLKVMLFMFLILFAILFVFWENWEKTAFLIILRLEDLLELFFIISKFKLWFIKK